MTRKKQVGRPDLPLLSVNLPSGVVPRAEDSGRPAASEDLAGYQHVLPGDLVMNQLGKPHGALGVSLHEGIISPAYFVATISPSVDARFLHHLLRTRLYISEYERRGKYMPPNQFDISWDEFRQIELLLPPHADQRAIAYYLDVETARLDALIEKKRGLVRLLEEFETSVIDHFFASEDWPSSRLKYVIKLNPENLSEATDPELQIRYVDIGSVGRGRLVSEPDEMTFAEAPSRARRVVRNGDVIVSTVRTYLRAVWAVPNGYNGVVVSTGFAVLRPRESIDPTFLSLYCRSSAFIEQVVGRSVGVSYPGINAEDVVALPVPLPDVAYQQDVVTSVVKRLDDSSRARALLNQQIDLLRMRRDSLVTSAVTGELDIPGVAA